MTDWNGRAALILFVLAVAAPPQPAGAAADAPPAALPSFAEPAISPDNAEIAFVSAGDIWTVPAAGGAARLLVSHAATESRPLYSPDGSQLAFVSTRTGNGDVYVLTLATGEVKRLTWDDTPDVLDGWSRDGRWVYYSCSDLDLGAVNLDAYRIPAAGGTPLPVVSGLYTNEFGAAPSPDGKAVAFCAGGAAARDWWRKGHAHWDETQIWLTRPGDRPTYQALTPPGAKDTWPMWAADGKTLYYVSDRGGAQNVWVCTPAAAPLPTTRARQVTTFADGRVLWPSIAYDGSAIVFERDFGVWRLDTKTGEAREIPITLRGAPQTPAVLNQTFTGGFTDLALSPDGRKLAVVAHGEVFAAPATGGPAARVTHTPAAEGQIEWAPDSRRLAYVSQRGAAQNVYVYDFAAAAEAQVTSSDLDDSAPRFSPDGRTIAFIRDGRDLMAVEPPGRRERVLARGMNGNLPPFDDGPSPFVWSPRGQWIAYIGGGAKGFDNVYVTPAAGEASAAVAAVTGGVAAPQQVTFFANAGSNSVSWSPDGRFLLFGTGQRTEEFQLARVNLTPRPPSFVEDQFRGLFQDPERTLRPGGPRPVPERSPTTPAPATRPIPTPQDLVRAPAGTQPATRPATTGPQPIDPGEGFSLAGIRQRIGLLPIGLDVDFQAISPDGRWAVIVGSAAGRPNLYLYPTEGEGGGLRQITSTPGGKSAVQWGPDNRSIYYLEAGQIRVASVDGGPPRDVPVSAPMDVDFESERIEVGRQAWKYLGLNFFDPHFHGVNWDAVRAAYFPRFAGARTPDELRRLLSLMVGELNASHLGVRSPGRQVASVGRLGIRFDPGAYADKGQFRVADVVPLGPAAVAGIKAGDYLLALDGVPLTARSNFDALLDRKVGRRVVLTRAVDAAGKGKGDVPVQPVDVITLRTLLYRGWVEQNRSAVETASDGRLAYVHIPDMGNAAIARLTADLDARAFGSEGVVIDVRGNTGGFASPYVLDIFARKGYLTMTRRGAEPAPGRPYVGQRSLELPTVLVTNRQSVSDAENFTEGYRALGLGKVVGEPTAGGVIFTSETQLLDGSTFRIPFSKVSARDGSGLESIPRPVDVEAAHPPGEEATGADGQLDAAVRELMRRLRE